MLSFLAQGEISTLQVSEFRLNESWLLLDAKYVEVVYITGFFNGVCEFR